MMHPISTSQLRALHPHLRGMQWLQGLAASGLRRSSCSEAEAVYGLAAQIHELDEAIQQTYAMEKLHFSLPKGWWIWVPLLYLLGYLQAFRKDSFDERVIAWGSSLILFGVLAVWMLSWKARKEYKAKAEKERQRPLLQRQRAQAMEELIRLRDDTIEACKASGLPMAP